MSEHPTGIFGDEPGRGLPTPLLNELERLLEQESVTEERMNAKVPELADKLLPVYEQLYGKPLTQANQVEELRTLVRSEGWNYLLQKKDGEAS